MLVSPAVQCCKLSASWSSWPRRDPRMLLSALLRFLRINHSDHFLRINHFYGTQSLRSFPTDQLSHSANFFGLVRFVRACWVPFCLKKISSRGKEWGEAKESSRIWSLYRRLASIHNILNVLDVKKWKHTFGVHHSQELPSGPESVQKCAAHGINDLVQYNHCNFSACSRNAHCYIWIVSIAMEWPVVFLGQLSLPSCAMQHTWVIFIAIYYGVQCSAEGRRVEEWGGVPINPTNLFTCLTSHPPFILCLHPLVDNSKSI